MGAMLALDPNSRPTMVDVLGHPWFRGNTVSEQVFEEKAKGYIEAAFFKK